jgi:hypothetical protein
MCASAYLIEYAGISQQIKLEGNGEEFEGYQHCFSSIHRQNTFGQGYKIWTFGQLLESFNITPITIL